MITPLVRQVARPEIVEQVLVGDRHAQVIGLDGSQHGDGFAGLVDHEGLLPPQPSFRP